MTRCLPKASHNLINFQYGGKQMRKKGECVICGKPTIDENGKDWLYCPECKSGRKHYDFDPLENGMDKLSRAQGKYALYNYTED